MKIKWNLVVKNNIDVFMMKWKLDVQRINIYDLESILMNFRWAVFR